MQYQRISNPCALRVAADRPDSRKGSVEVLEAPRLQHRGTKTTMSSPNPTQPEEEYGNPNLPEFMTLEGAAAIVGQTAKVLHGINPYGLN